MVRRSVDDELLFGKSVEFRYNYCCTLHLFEYIPGFQFEFVKWGQNDLKDFGGGGGGNGIACYSAPSRGVWGQGGMNAPPPPP